MRTTLALPTSLLLLSSLLLSTACNDSGGDPTAVWDDERVRNQGALTVSPSSFQVREGESVTLRADYDGTAQFSPSQVSWTVRPVGAGTVQNGVFTADVAGGVMIEGRFSSLADTAEATIRPELIDFVAESPTLLEATAGRVMPDSVTVKVLGRGGAPVSSEPVEFVVLEGNGNVSRTRRWTDAEGLARVAWLLGPRAGENLLEVRVEGFDLDFAAEGLADRETARLRAVAGLTQQGVVGELLPAPLVVEVTDANANPLPGMDVRWTFLDGAGVEDPSSQPVPDSIYDNTTGEDGRARLFWRLGDRAGSQTVEVGLRQESVSSGPAAAPGNGKGKGQTKFEASANPGHLSSLTVEPTSVSMAIESSVQLSATGVDEFGNTVELTDVNWSSDNGVVATVDGGGLVTGVADGVTRIEGKVGPVRGYADVTVTGPAAPAVTRVESTPESLFFGRHGASAPVDATAFDESGAVVGDALFTWTSTDPLVAAVSAAGEVTAVGNGQAEVVVQSECCAAADTVAVLVDEPAVVSVEADPSSLTLSTLGETVQLGVTLLDASGAITDDPVTWTSADPLVAAVDGAGLVTAVANGSTTIVVSADCCAVADTVEVVVHEPTLDYVEASPKSMNLTVGDTAYLDATAYNTAGDTMDVALEWATSNESIVTVGAAGRAIARAQGMASIVVAATCCTAADTVLVGVDEEAISPSRVEASWESVSFHALEQTFQLAATAYDEQEQVVSDARITWTSTDPSVASVDSMGLITARGNGLAAIVVASSCCTVPDTVPVTMDQEVASVTVSPGSLSLEIGQDASVLAEILDANGFDVADAQPSWRSSNPDAADVDPNGHVVAVAEGEAQVAAEAEGETGSMTTMVTEATQDTSVEPIFSDGFESGGLGYTANDYRWSGSSGGVAVVSAPRAHTGSKVLSITNEGGDPDHDTFRYQGFSFGQQLKEVWTEIWVYIPSNYYHRDTPSSDNNKFFQLWADKRSTPDKLSMILEVNQDGKGDSYLRPTRDNNMGLAGNFTNSIWNFITDQERGKWNRLQVHVKVGTYDNHDGVIQVWWNDVLWVDEHSVNYYMDPDGNNGSSNFIANGRLLGWANSGYDDETTFLFDDFKVYDRDPGW